MEHKDLQTEFHLNRKEKIAHFLSRLPRKILAMHGRDNIIEFVLHELGRSDCFDLEKAAYIVDNPDFNCLKGVAGFLRAEAFETEEDIWNTPDSFSEHMHQASFNAKVREYQRESYLKKGENNEQIIKEIAPDLGFEEPLYCAWDMKYDNRGILLYEKHNTEECDCDYLLDGLCLIGFCPVF